VISSFALAHRRKDLDRAKFNDHWQHVHGPLIARLDYLRGYTQNMAASSCVGAPSPFANASVDGIAGFYWDDIEDARRPATDPTFTEAGQLDETNFLDLARLVMVETVPELLRGPSMLPADAGYEVKAILLICQADAARDQTFDESCREHWGAASPADNFGPDRCVLHLARSDRSANAHHPAAIVEAWWDTREHYAAWCRGVALDALVNARIVDAAQSSIFLASEHHVIVPPPVG
jgi:uncharacterized protein (TIGR02118 family)